MEPIVFTNSNTITTLVISLPYFLMYIKIYKTYFTLRVKAKVQLKLNVHVGAFIEINAKGFTLKVKVEI
jgi:hypothetical protein